MQDSAALADLTSLHAAATYAPSSSNTAPASSGTKKPFRLGRKCRKFFSNQQQQLHPSRLISLPAQPGPSEVGAVKS